MSKNEGVAVRGRKEFEGGSVAYSFVNHIEVIHVGTDVFIDIGRISPDQVLIAARKKEANPEDSEISEVTFTVEKRIAMSVNTFAEVCKKINEIFDRMKQKQLLADAFLSREDHKETPA